MSRRPPPKPKPKPPETDANQEPVKPVKQPYLKG